MQVWTSLEIDNWITGTKDYYRRKSTPYGKPLVAAVATMMKPRVADSTTTLILMTYFGPKMPTNMGLIQGSKKAWAGMTGNQTKMTNPLYTMSLQHKSSTVEQNHTTTNTTTHTTNLNQKVAKQTKCSNTMVNIPKNQQTMAQQMKTKQW